MTSDKNNDLDLGMDMGADVDENNDVMDVEGIDEPLSAAPLGGADEYDADEDDFAEDEDGQPETGKKKKGGMTKVVAPMLVLLTAAAAGAYIVMNPAILGGAAPAQVQADSAPVVPATETAMLPPPDTMPGSPPETGLMAADVPPQPLPALNEAPADVAIATPVVTEPAADAAVPEILPEAVAAEAQPTTPADTPVIEASAPEMPAPEAPVVQEDTTQILAGSDVAVAPEAVNVAAEPAAVETTEPAPAVAPPVDPVVPDVVPEVPAPAQAAAPEIPAAPAAPMDVSTPTFVPAAPEAAPAPAPANAPVEIANPAAPPAMAAQDVAAAQPVVPPVAPSTAPAVPAAVSGQASAPAAKAAPTEASNIYYDSMSHVPTGAMAASVGPREVNPVMEPASKMVIVSKDKGEGSEESLLVSANRALKLKRYDSALEMYDQLYAKNKRDVRILMGRAVAQQNMGLSESAIQSYEEVLALKPDNTEALVNMMGLVRKQYPEVALRRLLEMYSRHPNNAGIAAQIGVTNAGLGHYDDAMRYLGIASTLEPHNAQHLFNMAIAADHQGNKAMAIQLYERALETDVMYGASRSVPRESIYDRLSALRRS